MTSLDLFFCAGKEKDFYTWKFCTLIINPVFHNLDNVFVRVQTMLQDNARDFL